MDETKAADRRQRISFNASRAAIALEYMTALLADVRVELLERLYGQTRASDLKTENMASIAGGLSVLDDLERAMHRDLELARKEDKKTYDSRAN